MPSQHLLTRPASIKACVSTTAPFSKDSKEPTLIAMISFAKMLLKPLLGTRLCKGIWPPSKPGRMLAPDLAF